MMVFLADDIFVPEVRGVSRLAPYEHKNYSQTQTQKFVSRNGILEKFQLRYFSLYNQQLEAPRSLYSSPGYNNNISQ
jgi:hypothetical protein